MSVMELGLSPGLKGNPHFILFLLFASLSFLFLSFCGYDDMRWVGFGVCMCARKRRTVFFASLVLLFFDDWILGIESMRVGRTKSKTKDRQ